MMKHHLLAILLCSLSILSLSQSTSLSGTIIDKNNKEQLPFTNIVFLNNYHGTVSNIDGVYVLDVQSRLPSDSIAFSHIGYQTLKTTVEQLLESPDIELLPAAVNLLTYEVSSKELTALEIVELVEKNFDKNHPKQNLKQRLFYHKYESFPFSNRNKLIYKKSDFVGIDKQRIEDIMGMMPDHFTEYQDAVIDLANHENEYKLLPIQAISLQEGSQKQLEKMFQEKMGDFMADFEKSQKDKDVYYKFKTGIISQKINTEDSNDSLLIDYKDDSTHYPIYSKYVRMEVASFLKSYTTLSNKNLSFITDTRDYTYQLDEITAYNDELVYKISFTPDNDGLFIGSMYVSKNSFALLQLDYAFAADRQTEKFQLFGIGHAINFKKARVIFEKGENGYALKYIYAQKKESISIERNFSILKKKKRLLWDKELNEMKFRAELFFNTDSEFELLIMNKETIPSESFEALKEPKFMKFKKEYSYSPEIWKDKTVLTPSTKLQNYKRN